MSPRHACLMGLEGMVSKHRESTYRGGRFDSWIKIKNRTHPAFSRVQDQFGQPVPMRPCGKSGRISAPRLPQTWHTNLSSMSNSRR